MKTEFKELAKLSIYEDNYIFLFCFHTRGFWFLCLGLMIVLLTGSCSSKEDKLSTIVLPAKDTVSQVVDNQIKPSVYPDLPPPPVVEKPAKSDNIQTSKSRTPRSKAMHTDEKPVKKPDVATPESLKMVEEQIFMRAEQMPRFPGCERNTWSENEKSKCAEKKLLDYIRANLKYPPQALNNNIQGEVLIKFVVDKEGNIGQTELISDPGSGMGKAAFDVVNSMRDLNQKWTPGYQQGNPVSVWFVLPIRFSLGDRIK